jgi:hypothetical protein
MKTKSKDKIKLPNGEIMTLGEALDHDLMSTNRISMGISTTRSGSGSATKRTWRNTLLARSTTRTATRI